MKKMRRILSLLFVAVMMVSLLSGCGSDEGTGPVAAVDLTNANLETIGQEAVKVFENVDSLRITGVTTMDLTLGGIEERISASLESDVDLKTNSMHTIGTSKSGDLAMTMDMYVMGNEDNATIYANLDNTSWMKQELPFAQLEAMEGYTDAIKETKFIIGALKGTERTAVSHMGKNATKISGTLDWKDPEGTIDTLGLGDMGLTTGQIVNMLTGLDGIEIDLYVESATGLPLELEIDMTAFLSSMFKNLVETYGGGQPVDMSVESANIKYQFSDYNNVTVSVPAEVESAVSGN